jgi:hypothetical protein
MSTIPATNTTPAKRLTLSEIVTLLLEHRSGAAGGSSVSLTRNARGVTQIEVTVREDDDLRTPDLVAAEATRIYDNLRARFPMPNGLVGAVEEIS